MLTAAVLAVPAAAADRVTVNTPILDCEGDVDVEKPWEGGIGHLRENLQEPIDDGACSNPQPEPLIGF